MFIVVLLSLVVAVLAESLFAAVILRAATYTVLRRDVPLRDAFGIMLLVTIGGGLVGLFLMGMQSGPAAQGPQFAQQVASIGSALVAVPLFVTLVRRKLSIGWVDALKIFGMFVVTWAVVAVAVVSVLWVAGVIPTFPQS